jgi:predicted phosphodiesterase
VNALRHLWPCLLACACVSPDVPSRYVPAWEPFDPKAPGWEATGKVLLVSDTQVHNLLSQALPERNLSVEAASGTAIRPPQLDLFAPEVLEFILRHEAKDVDLVLHLGDALDLACEGELDAFLAVMQAGGKPWLMAPGNHDFYYFGSYDPDAPELWAAACHGAGGRVDKITFIRRYVGALCQQHAFAPLAEALQQRPGQGAPALPSDFEWHRPEGAVSPLLAIAWHIDPQRPWRSFLLQMAQVPQAPGSNLRARMLLLDSCQYWYRPALIPNAWASWPVAMNCGFTGEMLPDQLRLARAWIEADAAGTSTVMMCHHPFQSLAPRTRSSVGWLWREHHVGLLVTGHTHRGYYQNHDLGGASDELELNLGSTTDWPMEWRTLQGFVNREQHQIYVRAERHTLVPVLREESGCFAPGWEVPFGAPDDYRGYRQGQSANGLLFDFYLAHHLVPWWLPPPVVLANAAARATEEQVKQTLLWTYLRLIQTFPTDPASAPPWPAGCHDDLAVLQRIQDLAVRTDAMDAQIDLLAELQRFEHQRKSRDPRTGEPTDQERLRFKLSQAAWASRYESTRGRRLQVEDELIRVDWETTRQKRERTGGSAPLHPAEGRR